MPFKRLAIYFRVFTLRNANHPLGLIGLLVMYISGLMLLILLSLDLLGFHTSPYMGIVTFMGLPIAFGAGIGLVFLGRVRARKRVDMEGKRPLYPFPQWDLNQPEHRSRFVILVAGVTLLITLVATLTYRGVEFMESVTFCGKTCHSVMQPEHVAYLGSPHARVSCVECHIGPGANWFVKSKLSGLRQVFAVAFNTFSRPIPTPIHNLRPARETCEQCHWPEKFHGDKVFIKRHYESDEENSELTNVLILKVGGGSAESGFAEGIHWHMSLENEIHYISDEKREEIYWIRSKNPDGTVREYVMEDFEMPADFLETQEIRRMDCMDCHNRPTHTFQSPGFAVDEAIAAGHISQELPFIKREAMKAIRADYASREEAAEEIPARLASFYRKELAGSDWADSDELRRAADAISDIYLRNIFPDLEIGWGTYPNHIGHEESPGCFRCHDEEHTTASGEFISQDCDNCHSLLAWEESEPEILDELFP